MTKNIGNPQPVKGRFAPSPSGRLHAGNIFAALITWLLVKSQNGKVLLRIEDLDKERSKSEHSYQIQKDFERLGLFWDEGPVFQSDRQDAYREAYEKLAQQGLVYSCFCTRAQIKAMREAASAPNLGDGGFYPGTCRDIPHKEQARLMRSAGENHDNYSFRLKTESCDICFDDIFQGNMLMSMDPSSDDFIIRRSDGAFAYQLAVVVDDAEQGVNLVSRGIDLLSSTPKQAYIHRLLGIQLPIYAHFPLFINEEGKRLAKRDRSAAMDELICEYETPEALIGHIAYIAGILPEDGILASPVDLLPYFKRTNLTEAYKGVESITFS